MWVKDVVTDHKSFTSYLIKRRKEEKLSLNKREPVSKLSFLFSFHKSKNERRVVKVQTSPTPIFIRYIEVKEKIKSKNRFYPNLRVSDVTKLNE